MRQQGIYEKYIKRPLDFTLSLSGLTVLSPLFIVLTAVGAVEMKGNPFFVQERPGLNEEIFKLIKFRTMTNEKDSEGNLLPDEERKSKYGEMLRNTSLDEIPELINIVKGEMSLVGPRPLLVQYLPLYNEEQHHRHDVRPGLTGLAQVNGRFNLLWSEKFQYDLQYVENISFKNDFKIILQTIISVLKKEDTENEVMGSWYPFLGNDVEDQQITLRKTQLCNEK